MLRAIAEWLRAFLLSTLSRKHLILFVGGKPIKLTKAAKSMLRRAAQGGKVGIEEINKAMTYLPPVKTKKKT